MDSTLPSRSTGFRIKAADLKPLVVRSNSAAGRQALGHLGAIGLAGLALWHALGSVWAVPLTVLLGYLIAFLFNVLHETAHQTPFKSRPLNYALGHIAGLAIGLPYEYYRAFHWDHHRYTQDPARDPELSKPLPTTRAGLVWYWSGLPTWIDRARMLLRHGVLGRVTEPWVGEAVRPWVVREARCYLALYVAVIAVSIAARFTAAVWLWVLPVMVGQLFIRTYLLVEHTGCAESNDMLQNTRTTHTNAFVRFFAWNMPYHVEHHAYPAVPFHALPRLHALLAEHTVHSARGYTRATGDVLRHLAARRIGPPPAGAPRQTV